MTTKQLRDLYLQHLMFRMAHIRRHQAGTALGKIEDAVKLELLQAIYNSVEGLDLQGNDDASE